MPRGFKVAPFCVVEEGVGWRWATFGGVGRLPSVGPLGVQGDSLTPPERHRRKALEAVARVHAPWPAPPVVLRAARRSCCRARLRCWVGISQRAESTEPPFACAAVGAAAVSVLPSGASTEQEGSFGAPLGRVDWRAASGAARWSAHQASRRLCWAGNSQDLVAGSRDVAVPAREGRSVSAESAVLAESALNSALNEASSRFVNQRSDAAPWSSEV